MPTTIYDASQITKRNRDRIIAQQVQQRNATGQPIIVPQAGYASYVMEEKDNGAITDFRKVGECTNINPACSCYNIPVIENTIIATCPLLTSQASLGYQDIFLKIQLPSKCNFTSFIGNTDIEIQGIFTINWGDGTIESFNSPNRLLVLNHIYQFTTSCAQYIIGISGDIISLIPTTYIPPIISLGEGCTYAAYPRIIEATFVRTPLLTTLNLNSNNVDEDFIVTGLNNCTSLINFQLSYNSVDYSPIYTFSNLANLALVANTNITTTFNTLGLPLLQLQIGKNPLLKSIIGLSSLTALTGLDINNCPFTDIDLSSNINLNELNIESTLLNNGIYNSTNFLNSLALLTNLTRLQANNTLFDSTSNLFLSGLPSSLIYLDISATKFTGIFSVPIQLTNLNTLYITDTNITSITSFPTSLTNLNCSYTQLNSLPSPLPLNLTFIDCTMCNIGQTQADTIASDLVANASPGGTLFITDQSTGTISTSGLIWDNLRSLGWNIN